MDKSIIIPVAIGILIIAGLTAKDEPKECAHYGCTNNAHGDSIFCRRHDPEYDDSESGIEVHMVNYNYGNYGSIIGTSDNNNSGRNDNNAGNRNNNRNNSNNSSNNRNVDTNSDNNVEMPDCDDYEDYEEYIDDWDGVLPDGTDADDYWDNW